MVQGLWKIFQSPCFFVCGVICGVIINRKGDRAWEICYKVKNIDNETCLLSVVWSRVCLRFDPDNLKYLAWLLWNLDFLNNVITCLNITLPGVASDLGGGSFIFWTWSEWCIAWRNNPFLSAVRLLFEKRLVYQGLGGYVKMADKADETDGLKKRRF